jgi:transcriptional antiterminator NusG
MTENVLPQEPAPGVPGVPEPAHVEAPSSEPQQAPETTPAPEPEPAVAEAPEAGPAAAAPEAAPAPAAEEAAEEEVDEEANGAPDAEAEGDGAEAAAPAAEAKPSNMRWYVVKVQSGREESIKEAIERRVKKEGLEEFYGQIVIPTERVTEMRNNKRVVKERKLYPGYLMVEVEYNDRILYLFRETSGVGDFVGGSVHRAPPPMPDREVEAMLRKQGGEVPGTAVTAKPKFDTGDRVKVKDGTFAGMEGEVKEILEAVGRVRVELTIFGRPVPVELEYWQVEEV